MCKKHTQTLKSDRFLPDFVWKLSEFWVFLKVPKIKVLFVSDWLLTKSCFCTEPAHGGRYENGASFYLPPFLSGNFTLKILTEITYLVGRRSENAGKFLSSPNGLFRISPTFYPQQSSILTEVVGEDKKTLTIFSSLIKILWSFFHKTASQGLLCCSLPLTRPCRNCRDTPLKTQKGGKTSPAAEVRLITVPGNRKTCAVRSSLLEAVHTRRDCQRGHWGTWMILDISGLHSVSASFLSSRNRTGCSLFLTVAKELYNYSHPSKGNIS